MFRNKISDLHLHLNGSMTDNFLEKTAQKNNCKATYLKLKKARADYKVELALESKEEKHDKSIKLIWAQFAYIHEIIQTLEDIKLATIDVVEASTAKYLEIRTTPKPLQQQSAEEYIKAFVDGLRLANEKLKDQKYACGILSLDRTIHTEETAYQIIDRIEAEKKRSGLLVGVDLSGNPAGKRTLTGSGLAKVLHYALVKDIGVAIHLGEMDNAIESAEVDNILAVLSEWKEKQHNKNPFFGKVRLGHAIFLTEAQQKLIKSLNLPIEVCPSCHKKINWWNKNSPHPVMRIYNLWKDPVVIGTDDEFIFGGNAKQENQTVLNFLDYPKNENRSAAKEHQAQFRFSSS